MFIYHFILELYIFSSNGNDSLVFCIKIMAMGTLRAFHRNDCNDYHYVTCIHLNSMLLATCPALVYVAITRPVAIIVGALLLMGSLLTCSQK